MERIIKSCSYKIDDVPPNGSAPHVHVDNSEIIQPFESEGSIMIGGNLYKMKKNGLYFIDGLTTHFVAPKDITKYNHSIITFDIIEMERLCKNLNMIEEQLSQF